MLAPAYLTISPDIKIAYQQLPGKTPGIIFCCGFMSDMNSTKALALEQFCKEQGRAFVRFDYQGHGQSSGKIEECTIGFWKNNALAVLEQLTQGSQLIVGSSMGGWIALLTALACPHKIIGLITIAAAPDFTENLIWNKLSVELQASLLRDEVLYQPSHYSEKPYAITRRLIEEGRRHLILNDRVSINCPVRLIHGVQDQDVPWQYSLQLLEKIQTDDIRLTLIKDGDHRLSRDQDLLLLKQLAAEML